MWVPPTLPLGDWAESGHRGPPPEADFPTGAGIARPRRCARLRVGEGDGRGQQGGRVTLVPERSQARTCHQRGWLRGPRQQGARLEPDVAAAEHCARVHAVHAQKNGLGAAGEHSRARRPRHHHGAVDALAPRLPRGDVPAQQVQRLVRAAQVVHAEGGVEAAGQDEVLAPRPPRGAVDGQGVGLLNAARRRRASGAYVKHLRSTTRVCQCVRGRRLTAALHGGMRVPALRSRCPPWR